MKTVIVQGDGIASNAFPEFDGQTLLQAANTPNLDDLANQGEFGYLTLPTEGRSLSSIVTHMALLGYDPNKYYSGLGQFESVSLEVVLEKHDTAFLCQFVTLSSMNGRGDYKKLGPSLILDDEDAGGIDSEDARELIDSVNEELGSETIQFYLGERHRHLMVWIDGMTRCGCQNPKLAQGQNIEPFLPSGKGSEVIRELMEASRILLRHHPVNQAREQSELKPVNCLWLWGPGKAVELPQWTKRWSISNVTISPVGVHRGMAMCAGIDVMDPHEYREPDLSDFTLSAQLCRTALQTKDFVYLHVPMPSTGRTANRQVAIEKIEAFDEQVIGPLLQSSSEVGDCRLMVVCNHADEEVRGVSPSLTPFAYLEKTGIRNVSSRICFDEIHAANGAARDATRVASRFLAAKVS